MSNRGGLVSGKVMKRIEKNVLRLPMEKRAELALQKAVNEVIVENARLGLPLYVGGEDGKVGTLPPKMVRALARSLQRK
jgi:hypothetical protein